MKNGKVEYGDVYKLPGGNVYICMVDQTSVWYKVWDGLIFKVGTYEAVVRGAKEATYLGNISQELKGFFEALEKMK